MNKLRVTAYCRVSTNHEEQESSLEAQISYYEKLITAHDDWNLVRCMTSVPFGKKIAPQKSGAVILPFIRVCPHSLNYFRLYGVPTLPVYPQR